MALPPRWSKAELENTFPIRSVSTSASTPDPFGDLLHALETIPVGIAVTDLSGRILHLNRRILEWLEYGREEVAGMGMDRLTGGAIGAADLPRVVAQVLEGVWRGETACVRRDGSSVPVFLESSPLHDRTGTVTALIWVAHDLTEERAHQARLMAEEKAGTLGLIARNLAHQIRNHLAAINMSLYFLEESVPPGGEGPRHIEALRQEANRIKHVLDALALYARPPEPEFTEANLVDVVNQGLEQALPTLRLRSVAVRRQFPGDSPAMRIDRAQLAGAIAQVVQNSAESMEHPGEVHVVIKRQPLETATRWLIEIRDDGPGIALDLQDRLFEPFFSTAGSQLGLGLSIVRRVMQLHGGDVLLESAPGRGTVVTLRLPGIGEEEA